MKFQFNFQDGKKKIYKTFSNRFLMDTVQLRVFEKLF
jgi:hypothetical protein